MPFILSKVSGPLTREQEVDLKSGLGSAIALVPGKTEASLLISLEGDCRLYLRGDDSEPVAYITVAVFDNLRHQGYAELSQAIAKLYETVLGIDPTRIYIRYEDIEAWSVAGRAFSVRSGR